MNNQSLRDRAAKSYATALALGLLVFFFILGIKTSWTMLSEYEGKGMVAYEECLETEDVDSGFDGGTKKVCVDSTTTTEKLEDRVITHLFSSFGYGLIVSLISTYFIRANRVDSKQNL